MVLFIDCLTIQKNLLLCFTDEKRSYRFENVMRLIKWWSNDYFWLKYSFKLSSKHILTDTLPAGRLSLSLSSFQIILDNLVCLSEVRKINTNLWDDKHHNPIFSPLHYRHCSPTTFLHVRSRHSRTNPFRVYDSEHCEQVNEMHL